MALVMEADRRHFRISESQSGKGSCKTQLLIEVVLPSNQMSHLGKSLEECNFRRLYSMTKGKEQQQQQQQNDRAVFFFTLFFKAIFLTIFKLMINYRDCLV